MYSFANLSNKTKDFINVTACGFKPQVRNIGLANALAKYLVLPSSEVENQEEFFIDNCFTKVREDASAFNELCVIDVDTVISLAKQFWRLRYNALYQEERIYVNTLNATAMDFFGIGMVLSPEVCKTLSEEAKDCITATNGYFEVFKELNGIKINSNQF